LGVQEPASVLFSLANLWAHAQGLRRLRRRLPAAYPPRAYYERFALVSCAAWTASAVFHTRDFTLTERVDYFGAGASVLYGLFYTVVRLGRLCPPTPPAGEAKPLPGAARSNRRLLLRLWTVLCAALYAAHVGYLTLVRWDYGYNMAANVVVGVVQNFLWSAYSVRRWRDTRRPWAVWPGLAVAWIMMAMGLELFDFAPLWGAIDAHSLWHAATVAPAVLWYNFLVKDGLDDLAGTQRLKA
jgi:post-GPI attachment to proteins factor 3